jgi:hypothetical protein
VTRPRRRPRTVYRVYGEEEYLAGAVALADCAPPADECTRGRRLRRLAGAAALTGAVGTVGGAVGLTALRAHAADRREIAEYRAPYARAAVPRGGGSPAPVRVTSRRHGARLDRPRRARADASRPALSRAPRIDTRSTSEMRSVSDTRSASGAPARAIVASTVRDAPAEAPAKPRAQGEFGFER